ncbi:hypothetical protein A0J61_01499 [Choanephora cucurbitarum]|uniref:Tc1-like transposase DDE domain-containing protein n=1 Tax=Choanephora cucurbitarum TaxID=101091 RepID=A0A1C7NMT4_9FUNG|nr:hypothetical protein A0J61_01499 [Choanephora cucurbitarum]
MTRKNNNIIIKNKRVSNEVKAQAAHLADIHSENSARVVALDLSLKPRSLLRWYAEGKLAETTKNAATEHCCAQPTAAAGHLLVRLSSTFEGLSLFEASIASLSKRSLDYESEESTTGAFRAKQSRRDSGKKEMGGGEKEYGRTLHEQLSIDDTPEGMDRYPEMKGHYLLMANAPVHTSRLIMFAVESRGHKCIYLPPYFPELDPIEQS